MAKRPNSRRNLDIAIERVAGRGPAFVQARTLMADAVVAQMLPDGAVKGGSALKLRFGDPDMIVPKDAAMLFEALGFDPPSPVPVMRLSHQIAQKLHGLSEKGSKRAHDLVDLQLISLTGRIDLARTRETCERLFAYRGQQAWPPAIEAGSNWTSLYAESAEGLDVTQNLAEAVEWVNGFVNEIANS